MAREVERRVAPGGGFSRRSTLPIKEVTAEIVGGSSYLVDEIDLPTAHQLATPRKASLQGVPFYWFQDGRKIGLWPAAAPGVTIRIMSEAS